MDRPPAAHGVFTIKQATPRVTATNPGTIPYDGLPHPVTPTVAGVVPVVDTTPGATLEGIPVTVNYYVGSPPAVTPLKGALTAAGTYTAVAVFRGSVDYVAQSTSVTFTIGIDSPTTITLVDASGPYNGSPFAASATITGATGSTAATLENVGLALYYNIIHGALLSGAPTLVGAYTVEAFFAGMPIMARPAL